MSSIPLHPQYGLNPSVSICFFCGEAKEVVLLGNWCKKEAPRTMLIDYEPCPACLDHFMEGVLIIEGQTTPVHKNQIPIQEGVYPTGPHWVITFAAASRLMNKPITKQEKPVILFVSKDAAIHGGLYATSEMSET